MESREEWMCQGEHTWVEFYSGDLKICSACGHQERVSFKHETEEVINELLCALNGVEYAVNKAIKLLKARP